MRTIAGTFTLPDGTPLAPAALIFVAVQTSLAGVPLGATVTEPLADGVYDVELEAGVYDVRLVHATDVRKLGEAVVTDGPAIDLPTLLGVESIPYTLAQELIDRVEQLEHVPPGSGIAGIDNFPDDTSIEIDAETDPLRPRIRATGGGAAVTSVNGQSGVVVLTAANVGADAAGAATAAVQAHVEAPNPHGGTYLTPAAAAAAYAAIGAPAAAVAGHVAVADPHPGKYDAAGAAAAVSAALSAQINALDIDLTALEAALADFPPPGTLIVEGDARLTNARTPTAHASSHATGQPDAISPASIGAEVAGAAAAVGANLAAHAAATAGVHGIADTSLLVTSSNPLHIEPVTAYPDPQVPGVLYILLPP